MISLALPWPPSANTYWRMGNNRMYVSKKAKEYRSHVEGICFVEKVRIINGPVSVVLRVQYPKDKRSANRDLDNCVKVLLDCLEGIAFHNDNLVRVLLSRKNGISGKGEVEVFIRGCSDSPSEEEIHLAHMDLSTG